MEEPIPRGEHRRRETGVLFGTEPLLYRWCLSEFASDDEGQFWVRLLRPGSFLGRTVDVQTARYDEISKLEIERGTAFAELKVKTRGKLLGAKTLRVTRLSEQDAERAKAFIEEHMRERLFCKLW
jgi:hypothetical protein